MYNYITYYNKKKSLKSLIISYINHILFKNLKKDQKFSTNNINI